MAGLQRFITYIYKYENDEKMENTGFAKIEIRGGICRIEVHIRNINAEQTEATVYLFAEKENIIQGVPVGDVIFSKGNGDIRYAFETKELAGFGLTMQDMEGIWIPIDDSVYLASRWREGTIEQKRFRILEKTEKSNPSQPNDSKEKTAQSESDEAAPQTSDHRQPETKASAGGQSQASDSNTVQAPIIQETKKTAKNEEQPIQATELPLEEFFEESGWEGIFRKLRLKTEVFFPFEGQEIECIRMQLNDLREFPRKYWYIGNNSFLLHGFFNYRHIIFGEMEEKEEKKYFIGVPGVFMNQERIMAAMFGFPEFRTAKTTEYKTGNFGYWYRMI